MADIVRSWRVDFMRAHPRLFDVTCDEPERSPGHLICEVGWRDILERLCARIEHALREDETIQILQIGKKFAQIRVQWRGDVSPETAARLHEAFALAEARSAYTCERCGAAGRLYSNDGIYMTRCATHAQGAPVPSKPGQENVRQIYLPNSDGALIVARRYDRETDRFIDDSSDDAGIVEA
ncbi:hypothetical protein AC629_01860 [Bradyrhizobium sp. NAS80.1]|uniref:hypothetical protein n=1 Tax=Bradyrhizobium sp. NAS80.1 TaxID=1680159 RepID=UPI0009607A6F|nr:hypothetical protein [Bradyrhizobium sp. NAS80.1]OKO91721.1 hypothetical protein AC629_01860 [Bradyrhizobium sp. NAS80.1]